MRTPCLECGELTREGSYCSEHKPKQPRTERKRERDRAYGKSAWQRLSRRARRLQPFCASCGATNDLQCDHLPQAWERYERGLPVRLQDVQVLCGECNRKAGTARGERVTHVGRFT